MKDVNFDIKRVEFEDRYDSEEYGTTTLYFIAPKEWLGNAYPEAIHSEISVEYPFGFVPEANTATVMMSPTREDDEGNSEDYDWFDIALSLSDIEALISLSEKALKGGKFDEEI